MRDRATSGEIELSVAAVSPTRRQRGLALAIVGFLFVAVAAIAPFAAIQLRRIDSFVPAVEAIILVTDLITAVLLFNQFAIHQSRSVLVLASGYLFSALIVVPHVFTYPGAFAPTGLLGAGLQSTPWLYTFWHFGFPAAVIVYACLNHDSPANKTSRTSALAEIRWAVVSVVGLVCTLSMIVIVGEKFMPRLLVDQIGFAPLAHYVTALNFLTAVGALVLLWTRRMSVLRLWLMVTICASIAELAVVSLLIGGRFSLGFYAGRMFSVAVSTIVLIVLLTETSRLYARLSRTNKALQRERESKLMNLEAVAAAIAHEVKQPLTGIATRAAAARRFLDRVPPDVEKVKRLLGEMESASFSANEVFESIRTLFQNIEQKKERLDVNSLVLEALRTLREELQDRGITTDVKLTAELAPIMGHKGQLREVILNLCQNAIDAMEDVTGRRRVLRLTTQRQGPTAIAVSVEDSGPGIESEKIAIVFDPFVTTKEKGMGLGLAICRMIVQRHGGQLSASSALDVGTQFKIVLPIEMQPRFVPAETRSQIEEVG